jgi:carbon monoxide dehydrogenase subunit G
MTAKYSIHIEAPVETVFDSFKDPAKLWDLMPVATQLDDVKVTKEGVGTYYSWHLKVTGLPVVRAFDVLTDVVPRKHITDRSSNAMVGTWDYDFEPEGSGTKLTMEHHPQSFWRIPPLRNLMDLATERMSGSFMARVKDTIETPGN